MTTHWDKCVAAVTAHAGALSDAAKNRMLNPERIPVLLETFVAQPAYYAEWRERLIEIGMAHVAAKESRP